jgi:hypothetical protein
MTLKNKTKRATYTILVLLGLLVFASASGGAIGQYIPTVTEDTITCTPQKGSSKDLWTCTDYYGNRFKDLQISILIK